MKSCAPTVCAARTISSGFASGLAKAMFSATVPAKRKPSCGTIPSWRRSDAIVTSLRSTPAIVIRPLVGSYMLARSVAIVDLPAPVWPTSATVVPAGTSRSMPCSTSSPVSPPRSPYANRTWLKFTWPAMWPRGFAPGRSATSGCSSRTPMILSRAAVAEERVVELRELLDRVEEVVDVEHEGEEGRQLRVRRVLEVAVAAVAEHDGEGESREEADEREVDRVEDDGLHVRVAVAACDRAEVVGRQLLPRERLHHPHPRDVLGERRRDEAEPLPHVRVGARRAGPEERRRDAHERDHRERRECELPVEDEQ